MEYDKAFVRALSISSKNDKVFPQSEYSWTNEIAIVDLISLCRDEEDFALISELFQKLNKNIVDSATCYDLLYKMALAIKKNETAGKQTALCVMRTKNDSDSDGSQAIINELKVALTIAGGFDYNYSAVCFEDIERLYSKGYRHFVVVDDFIGTGKAVNARYNYFLNRHFHDATIGFYFIAGMAKGISYCKNKKIPVYCSKVMYKEISGNYQKERLLKRVWSMKYFESLLGKECGTVKLKDNSFGYGHAEALYCRQFGNIPNSVFPIFWWKSKSDGTMRKPVFTRIQNGY